METPSLVTEVQELSRELADVITRLPVRDLPGAAAGAASANDFLFELKVLFSLLNDLAAHHWDIQVANLQHQLVQLPRKPGLKKNFTYFHITSPTGSVWHLVHGTKIENNVGQKVAPDFSLQDVSSGHSPRFGQVKAIWDAKLHGHDGGAVERRITDDDLYKFMWFKRSLEVPHPDHGDPLDTWPPAFEVCGLISNGTLPSAPGKLFFVEGISAVQHFQNSNTPTYPNRRDHVHYQSEQTA